MTFYSILSVYSSSYLCCVELLNFAFKLVHFSIFTVEFEWPERQLLIYAFIVNNKVILYCTVSADWIALMVNRLWKGWMLSQSKEVVGTILMFLSHCYCCNVRTKSSHHHFNLVLLLVLLLCAVSTPVCFHATSCSTLSYCLKLSKGAHGIFSVRAILGASTCCA